MSEERYLWDKTGPADPLVARVETLLADRRRAVMRSGGPRRRRSWRFALLVGGIGVAAVALLWFALASDADRDPPAADGGGPPSTIAVGAPEDPTAGAGGAATGATPVIDGAPAIDGAPGLDGAPTERR